MTMPDELDNLICEIQETVTLSADARNALHGATSTHPWCAGKDTFTRALEVRCAIAGRTVRGELLHRLDRIARAAAV